MTINELFSQELNVVNIGLTSFKDALNDVRVPVIQVDFKPPIDVNPALRAIVQDKKTY